MIAGEARASFNQPGKLAGPPMEPPQIFRLTGALRQLFAWLLDQLRWRSTFLSRRNKEPSPITSPPDLLTTLRPHLASTIDGREALSANDELLNSFKWKLPFTAPPTACPCVTPLTVTLMLRPVEV